MSKNQLTEPTLQRLQNLRDKLQEQSKALTLDDIQHELGGSRSKARYWRDKLELAEEAALTQETAEDLAGAMLHSYDKMRNWLHEDFQKLNQETDDPEHELKLIKERRQQISTMMKLQDTFTKSMQSLGLLPFMGGSHQHQHVHAEADAKTVAEHIKNDDSIDEELKAFREQVMDEDIEVERDDE